MLQCNNDHMFIFSCDILLIWHLLQLSFSGKHISAPRPSREIKDTDRTTVVLLVEHRRALGFAENGIRVMA
jgi:hypothetical protein